MSSIKSRRSETTVKYLEDLSLTILTKKVSKLYSSHFHVAASNVIVYSWKFFPQHKINVFFYPNGSDYSTVDNRIIMSMPA